MNEETGDVKYALGRLKVNNPSDRPDADPSFWEDLSLILAHIDGEPARIAAACEEVREACAQQVPSIGQPHDCFEAVRATPLAATPLGDALVRAEEGVRYWTDLAQAEARDAAALRARVAELERDSAAMTVTANAEVAAGLAIAAERDALRAQVEALERERDMLQTALRDNSAAHSETGKALLRAEAQVEAARAECAVVRCGSDCDDMNCASGRCQTVRRVLAAMDEAKP